MPSPTRTTATVLAALCATVAAPGSEAQTRTCDERPTYCFENRFCEFYVACFNGPSGRHEAPDVAFDGDEWMVVWQDWRNFTLDTPNVDIYGSRVGWDGWSATGDVVTSGGAPIVTGGGNKRNVSLEWNGTSYLVAWSLGAGNGPYHVYGSIVSSTGTAEAPVQFFSGADDGDGTIDLTLEPAVASDGEGFLVVWDENTRDLVRQDVLAMRVDAAGQPLDLADEALAPLHLSEGSYSFLGPSVAYGGGVYMVVWNQSPPGESAPNDIYANCVEPDGTTAGSTGLALVGESDSDHHQVPAVAWLRDHFLVVYRDGANAVHGVRVSVDSDCAAEGGPFTLLGDPFPINSGDDPRDALRIACDAASCLVSWWDERHISEGIPFAHYATRVEADGTVSDPDGFPLVRIDQRGSGHIARGDSAYLFAYSPFRDAIGTGPDLVAILASPSLRPPNVAQGCGITGDAGVVPDDPLFVAPEVDVQRGPCPGGTGCSQPGTTTHEGEVSGWTFDCLASTSFEGPLVAVAGTTSGTSGDDNASLESVVRADAQFRIQALPGLVFPGPVPTSVPISFRVVGAATRSADGAAASVEIALGLDDDTLFDTTGVALQADADTSAASLDDTFTGDAAVDRIYTFTLHASGVIDNELDAAQFDGWIDPAIEIDPVAEFDTGALYADFFEVVVSQGVTLGVTEPGGDGDDPGDGPGGDEPGSDQAGGDLPVDDVGSDRGGDGPGVDIGDAEADVPTGDAPAGETGSGDGGEPGASGSSDDGCGCDSAGVDLPLAAIPYFAVFLFWWLAGRRRSPADVKDRGHAS